MQSAVEESRHTGLPGCSGLQRRILQRGSRCFRNGSSQGCWCSCWQVLAAGPLNNTTIGACLGPVTHLGAEPTGICRLHRDHCSALTTATRHAQPVCIRTAKRPFAATMTGMQLDPEHEAPHAASEAPVRRAPASPRTSERIRAQNRRREWLEQHPSYFESVEHELAGMSAAACLVLLRLTHSRGGRPAGQAHPPTFMYMLTLSQDPILYARLVKAFQTDAERQTETQEKGFGRILEADLARGEQRVAAAAASDPSAEATNAGSSAQLSNGANGHSHVRTADASTGIDNPWDAEAEDRADGRELWRLFLQERFIRGRDEEFDYDAVDGDWDLDVTARREAQDEWFEDEEPTWAEGEERARTGETGVQDF
ncbi:hypothetical protein Purlil1_3432 [Purpureocillium lilacinum]|uniref:CCD97-like C-terminal domain-containing protein n=1 Tax=Purpureocillium lilacinum TaxID=33203 RepID=A0ABR0C7E2_PURLI|nr:hypothetical protein Purlil1_3432 [Purpureocillium lilacinum]